MTILKVDKVSRNPLDRIMNVLKSNPTNDLKMILKRWLLYMNFAVG